MWGNFAAFVENVPELTETQRSVRKMLGENLVWESCLLQTLHLPSGHWAVVNLPVFSEVLQAALYYVFYEFFCVLDHNKHLRRVFTTWYMLYIYIYICETESVHSQFWSDLHKILHVASLYLTDGHGGGVSECCKGPRALREPSIRHCKWVATSVGNVELATNNRNGSTTVGCEMWELLKGGALVCDILVALTVLVICMMWVTQCFEKSGNVTEPGEWPSYCAFYLSLSSY